jgi:hypothetical protein
MMERLLAKMDANQAGMKAMQEQMDSNQEKAEAEQEEIKGMMNATHERMVAFTKSMREDIKSGQEEIRCIVDAWMTDVNDDRKETTACQDAMEGSLKKIESHSGEKEAIVERQKISNEEVSVHSLRACQRETAASKEATETEPDPGTMQSVEEHQEIRQEEAAAMPVGGLRK